MVGKPRRGRPMQLRRSSEANPAGEDKGLRPPIAQLLFNVVADPADRLFLPPYISYRYRQ